MATKRITRSRKHKVIGGVAGGLGEYLNVDPNIIRVLFVFLAFMGGSGLILYIVLLFVIPEDTSPLFDAPQSGKQTETFRETIIVDENGNADIKAESAIDVETEEDTDQPKEEVKDFSDLLGDKKSNKTGGLIAGLLLIFFGCFILFSKFISYRWFEFLFPVLLVLAGILIVIFSGKSKNR